MFRLAAFAAVLILLLAAMSGCFFSPSPEETREKELEVLARYERALGTDCPKADAEHWGSVMEAADGYDRLPTYVETGKMMSVLNDLEDALDDWAEVAEEEGCLGT